MVRIVTIPQDAHHISEFDVKHADRFNDIVVSMGEDSVLIEQLSDNEQRMASIKLSKRQADMLIEDLTNWMKLPEDQKKWSDIWTMSLK